MPITVLGKTKYRPYAHKSLHKISRAENSVVEQLTDLDNVANAPPSTLIFPPMEMQQPQYSEEIAATLSEEADKEIIYEQVLN